jgi:hypothetical protein
LQAAVKKIYQAFATWSKERLGFKKPGSLPSVNSALLPNLFTWELRGDVLNGFWRRFQRMAIPPNVALLLKRFLGGFEVDMQTPFFERFSFSTQHGCRGVVNLEGSANQECFNHGWNMGLILHHLSQFLWAEPYSS